MITEEMEDILIERIMRRQIKANEKILKAIGKVLGEIGDINPSEAYKINQMLKYGESLDNIIKILADASELTELEIYEMLEKEAKMNLGFKKRFFLAKKKDFIPYKENIALQNKVNEIAIATIGTYRNISKTTGITYLDKYNKVVTKPLKQAYIEIVDNAIYNISMGKETYYEALKRQLSVIGQHGIQSIEYESGYHRRIDSALMMNLQDGLNELQMAQQKIIGEQFGADGVEIGVHEFPAPDHYLVQGRIFSMEEFERLQNEGIAKDYRGFEIDIHNKYGSFRPIGTMNCYHSIFSIVLGIDEPRYTQAELNEINMRNTKGFEYEGKHYTLYQGTQMQRKMELEMRKCYEEELIYKSALENIKSEDEISRIYKTDKIKKKLEQIKKRDKDLTIKYDDFSKVSGLPTRWERTRNLIGKPTK